MRVSYDMAFSTLEMTIKGIKRINGKTYIPDYKGKVYVLNGRETVKFYKAYSTYWMRRATNKITDQEFIDLSSDSLTGLGKAGLPPMKRVSFDSVYNHLTANGYKIEKINVIINGKKRQRYMVTYNGKMCLSCVSGTEITKIFRNYTLEDGWVLSKRACKESLDALGLVWGQ